MKINKMFKVCAGGIVAILAFTIIFAFAGSAINPFIKNLADNLGLDGATQNLDTLDTASAYDNGAGTFWTIDDITTADTQVSKEVYNDVGAEYIILNFYFEFTGSALKAAENGAMQCAFSFTNEKKNGWGGRLCPFSYALNDGNLTMIIDGWNGNGNFGLGGIYGAWYNTTRKIRFYIYCEPKNGWANLRYFTGHYKSTDTTAPRQESANGYNIVFRDDAAGIKSIVQTDENGQNGRAITPTYAENTRKATVVQTDYAPHKYIVTDNVGNVFTSDVYRAATGVSVNPYYNGTSSKIDGGRVSLTANGASQTSTSGTPVLSQSNLTVGMQLQLSALTNDGYYLGCWKRFRNRTAISYIFTKNYNYTITNEDGSTNTTPIYLDALFYNITGSFGTSFNYNGSPQAPMADAPKSNISDGSNTATNFRIIHNYTGSMSGGGNYDSSAKPTNAGSYTYVAKITNSSGEEMGRKTVAFTINQVNLNDVTITSSLDNSVTYNGAAQTPTFTLTQPGARTLVRDTDYTYTTVQFTNASTYSITFSSRNINYNGTKNFTFTINKANITLNITNWGGLVYGQQLKDTAIAYTAVSAHTNATVNGAFSFNAPDTRPQFSDSGTTSYPYAFTPQDTGNYITNTGSRTIVVEKYTINTAAWTFTDTIIYGQKVSELLLTSGGTPTNGYYNDGVIFTIGWSGVSPDTLPLVSDSNSTDYTYSFVPYGDFTNNYTTITKTFKITVNKATPSYSGLTAKAITYEQPLSAAELTVTDNKITNPHNNADVLGTWSWDTANITAAMPTFSQNGSHKVIFTPTDTANYNIIEVSTVLTVHKKTQTFTFDALTKDNAAVRPESMDKKLADYEITNDQNSIVIKAYTTAIYPSASQIAFAISGANATISSLNTSLETINGIQYSVTTATLYLNATGITEITATPNGNPNYNDVIITGNAKLFRKNIHSAHNFAKTLQKNYGDTSFSLEPQLNSRLNDYTITSSNSNIVSVAAGANPGQRELGVLNAGQATLTLSHAGTIGSSANNYSDAYIAFSAEMVVTVAPTTLNVTINPLSVVYGVTPIFTYSYTGWKNNDADTLPIKDITTDYSIAMSTVIRNAGSASYGSYTVTPSGAQNANALYANYIFTYTSGKFTVTPKTLIATIENASKVYGTALPLFPISYEGFVYGETAELAATLNITLPTVNYNGVTQFSDVANYNISLVGGTANNYDFVVTDTATLTITPADAILNLENLTTFYCGMEQFNLATLCGLIGGSQPTNNASTLTYLYSSDGAIWTTEKPINADTYNIQVTYTAAASDNYATTTINFTNAQTISPVAPNIEATKKTVTYSSKTFGVEVLATAISNGSTPKGDVELLYTIDGKPASESATTPEFLATLPKNNGTYSVKYIYHPVMKNGVAHDNYKEVSGNFLDYLVINKADPTMYLTPKTTTYASSNKITPDNVSANVAEIHGVGAEYDFITTENRIKYEYFINGAYTEALPFNAGTYKVRITYMALANENYNTLSAEFSDGVTIAKANLVDLALQKLVTTYTGKIIMPNTPTYSGIVGGSAPLSANAISYKYQVGTSSYTSSPVSNAGSYSVKVIYTTANGDNYANTEKNFTNVLIIEKVNPTITMSVFDKFSFTGNAFVITAKTIGLPNASAPIGSLSYRYKRHGSPDAFNKVSPTNAGNYDVEVTYSSTIGDNYKDAIVIFNDKFVINRVKPDLFLTVVTADYTGDGVSASGGAKGAVGDPIGAKGIVSYQYYIAGKWTTDLPVNSGVYDVRVVYTATVGGLPETNYLDCDKAYLNALVINNIAPIISLSPKTAVYSGLPVVANTPTFQNSAGEAFGRLSIEYRINGEWLATPPTDAGIYRVRVVYSAAAVDNYKSESATFEASIIITALNITVTPTALQSKIYDGLPIAINTITFNKSDLIYGNAWTGSLHIAPQIFVGEYSITQGTLSAGSNYKITFTEGVKYAITPRAIGLVFSDINEVYDGNYKIVEITPDPSTVVSGDSVAIITKYDGDFSNVGTFTAIATMENINYSLPSTFSRDYHITPATMVGNKFVNAYTTYNGKPHSITMQTVVSGATVIYDNATEYTARGSYTVTATVSLKNYYDQNLTAVLIIAKGTIKPRVFAPIASYKFGDPLPKLTTNVQSGEANLNNDQILTPGTQEYNWTFVPFDLDNYQIETGTIKITTAKATAVVDVNGSLTQFVNNPSTITVNVVGDSKQAGTLTITYINAKGEVLTSVPTTAGHYTMKVVVSGNEYYEETVYTTALNIQEQPNLWWVYALCGAVALLIICSASYFFIKKHNDQE